MAVEDARRRYPDDRLDDKFQVIERDLGALRDLPRTVAELAEAQRQTNGRLDRMRADSLEDAATLREDIRRLATTQTGFFSALLVAVIAGVIVLAVVI